MYRRGTGKFFTICALSVVLLTSAVLCSTGFAAQAPYYVVKALIAPITDTPGIKFDWSKAEEWPQNGVTGELLCGNIVQVKPVGGAFAKTWGEVFFEGKKIGYSGLGAFSPMPKYTRFAPERFYFKGKTELFLLPGSLPLSKYKIDDTPCCSVLAGDVTRGVGSFKDAKGTEWTLLAFESERCGGTGLRHAWAKSGDLIRLSSYKPDYSRVNADLVPGSMRGYGKVADKFRGRIIKDGFAIDAAPVFCEPPVLDDMLMSYRSLGDELGYVETPLFLTSDLFLHSFRLLFERGLKKAEEKKFAPLTEKMLAESLKKLDVLQAKYKGNAALEPAFRSARDYLSVPAALASPKAGYRLSVAASEEAKMIKAAKGAAISRISGGREDYTFYRPRGHYTQSEALSNYFRATAFLGGMPILLNNPFDASSKTRDKAVMTTAVICTLFDDADLRKKWDSLYTPLAYLVGESDDPSIREFSPVVKKVIGGDLSKLSDVKTVDKLCSELLAAAKAPAIIDRGASRLNLAQKEREKEAAGMKLMGRRFVLDAWIFSKLTSPSVGTPDRPRNLPKCEDVMAALGSSVAEKSLGEDKKVIPGYKDALADTKAKTVEALRETSKNVYTDWLEMLALLFSDKKSSQYFANSPLWESKRLLTSLGSWTELKHDTVLYAKQNYAEMGTGEEWGPEPFRTPSPCGYVEPVPQVLGAIEGAMKRLGALMAQYRLADENYASKIASFTEIVEMYRKIAEKEVAGQALTVYEYDKISGVSGYLNAEMLLDTGFADDKSNKYAMPLVADVATESGAAVLHTAIGTPRRIFVFVDDKSAGPRLTVGFTYSVYSFKRPLSDGRMTDEEWRKIVYDKNSQQKLEKLMPEWSRALFVH